MIYKYDAAIIGGDLRQVFLFEELQKSGYKITTYGLNNSISRIVLNEASSAEEAVKNSKTIIGPIPFSKDKKYITGLNKDNLNNYNELTLENLLNLLSMDQYLIAGNIPQDTVNYLTTNNIPYFDLMKSDEISMLNAIATAEGAIAEAVNKSLGNLHDSNTFVLGYGRCAKVLAQKLKAFGAKVTICARKQSLSAETYTNGFNFVHLDNLKNIIHEFNYIFNTIPQVILTRELLLPITSDTAIIDIASAPGGLDYDAAKELGLNAHLCLGIPGKTAPKASAEILAEAIIPILKGSLN